MFRKRVRAGSNLPRGCRPSHPLGAGDGRYGPADEHGRHSGPDRGPEQTAETGSGTFGRSGAGRQCCQEYESPATDKGH